MLNKDENELFMRVGPGTAMGELMRRYWHAVGCSELVGAKPQRTKVLGEELLLYRAENGNVVLMDLRCAHRRVALDHGALRASAFAVRITAGSTTARDNASSSRPSPKQLVQRQGAPLELRVQEYSGIVFAYLGPEPAPLLRSSTSCG